MCKRRLQIIFSLLDSGINSAPLASALKCELFRLQCEMNAKYGRSAMENADLLKKKFS